MVISTHTSLPLSHPMSNRSAGRSPPEADTSFTWRIFDEANTCAHASRRVLCRLVVPFLRHVTKWSPNGSSAPGRVGATPPAGAAASQANNGRGFGSPSPPRRCSLPGLEWRRATLRQKGLLDSGDVRGPGPCQKRASGSVALQPLAPPTKTAWRRINRQWQWHMARGSSDSPGRGLARGFAPGGKLLQVCPGWGSTQTRLEVPRGQKLGNGSRQLRLFWTQASTALGPVSPSQPSRLAGSLAPQAHGVCCTKPRRPRLPGGGREDAGRLDRCLSAFGAHEVRHPASIKAVP